MDSDVRIARLEEEVAALRAEVGRLRGDGPSEVESDGARRPRSGRAMSRRALLRGAGSAAVAGLGGALAAGSAAHANDPNDVALGTSNNGGSATTEVTSTNTTATLRGTNSSIGNGVYGSTSASGANVTAGVFGIGANASGVRGQSTNGRGVYGISDAGPGAVGESTSSSGVIGGSGSGDGVYAYSTAGTSLVVDAPTPFGPGAHMQMIPGSIAGPPTTGTHALGQLWMDSAGALYQCVAAGTPGTWVKHAPLVTLTAPFRVYDSRAGQANPSGAPQGALAFGAGARTISCNPGGQIPGARTILFNLTATGTDGPSAGALLVWAAGATEPVASSINWTSAGVTLANAVTSACNASQQVQVKCVASAGSSTQFLLDIVGYYR